MTDLDLEHQAERRAYWRDRAETAEADLARERERTITLREALQQIADLRIARGGPENAWWDIACAALAASSPAEQEQT